MRKLYGRGWSFEVVPPYQATECVHAQLWNRGTVPIFLKSFCIMTTAELGPHRVVAGMAGNGDPNQDPLDGNRQRLVKSIADFGASYANGCDGTANGLPDGPPSALSKHGEMRGQISHTAWLLAQMWHGFVTHVMQPVTMFDGLVINPGHGWTIRAGDNPPGVSYAVSFVWEEDV